MEDQTVRDQSQPNPQLAAEAAKDPREAVPPVQTLSDVVDEALALLSPEEIAALVTKAAEARALQVAADTAALADQKKAAEEAAARAANPLAYVGLADSQDNVVYVKLKRPLFQHERTIQYTGTTYEHVREDADDVWIYRHM